MTPWLNEPVWFVEVWPRFGKQFNLFRVVAKIDCNTLTCGIIEIQNTVAIPRKEIAGAEDEDTVVKYENGKWEAVKGCVLQS